MNKAYYEKLAFQLVKMHLVTLAGQVQPSGTLDDECYWQVLQQDNLYSFEVDLLPPDSAELDLTTSNKQYPKIKSSNSRFFKLKYNSQSDKIVYQPLWGPQIG